MLLKCSSGVMELIVLMNYESSKVLYLSISSAILKKRFSHIMEDNLENGNCVNFNYGHCFFKNEGHFKVVLGAD